MDKKIFTLALMLLLGTSLGQASKKDGVEMPDSMPIEGKELILNGLGTRKATFFNVHVYVGGLYLEEKSQKPKEFINNNSLKHINMHFVRDVDKTDIVEGWNEAFENAVPTKTRNKIQEKIANFNSKMRDMAEGQAMKLTFYPQKVTFTVKDNGPHTIEGETFSRSLLSVWFINAKDQGLKKGLLDAL